MAASRPGFPSEPNLRRLGVGGAGGGGGGDRAARAQVLIALVLGFALIAAVMFVLRRPTSRAVGANDGGADAMAAPSPIASGRLIRTRLEAPSRKETKEKIALAPVQRVKCSASSGTRGNEGSLCDALPFFEEALQKAIAENVACAPRTGNEGTINYVLSIDFRTKRLGIFPGQSGTWKGPQAKRATECVRRSLPAPKWDSVPHQYGYYAIAILASYPAPEPLEAIPEIE
jgi:hypothetical protein